MESDPPRGAFRPAIQRSIDVPSLWRDHARSGRFDAVSAALSANTAPARAVHLTLEHGRLLFSRETFAEIETRTWRPKFDRYLGMDTRKRLLQDLDAVADWIDLERVGTCSRDSDDDKFVQTALTGKAELLISGDRDLLGIVMVQGLRIVTPAEAVEALRTGSQNPSVS